MVYVLYIYTFHMPSILITVLKRLTLMWDIWEAEGKRDDEVSIYSRMIKSNRTTACTRHSLSTAWPKKLSVRFKSVNRQWIFFFPDGSGIFQDDNAKIRRAVFVKEWNMRTHECKGARGVIFTHELATIESWLYPIKSLWDVLEKTEGMVDSCHQYKISAKNECNSGWK